VMTPMHACAVLCFLLVGTAAAPTCAETNDEACEAVRSQSLLQKTAPESLLKKTSRISSEGPRADGGAADCGGAGITKEFTVDGKPRCFQLYTPSSPTKPMPVIVFFHGKGGRASQSCRENGDMVSRRIRLATPSRAVMLMKIGNSQKLGTLKESHQPTRGRVHHLTHQMQHMLQMYWRHWERALTLTMPTRSISWASRRGQ